MLNIATGNLDREGGMMFPRPAMDLIKGAGSKPGHYGAWKSRVRGLPEFGGELPAAALAEEILTPGNGQVRALVTIDRKEHTSELQSLMRISYAVFCLKKKKKNQRISN